jgi:hypothetical protein
MRIAGDIDVMLARRVTLLILRPGSRSGWGRPCYAVGPVAKTETRYRFFDRMFTSRITPRHGLPRRSVTSRHGRPRGARTKELST